MDAETARIEHIKIIQGVIERLGRNSFAMKAGALTAFAGLVTVSIAINHWLVSLVGIVPIVLLWSLDAFWIRYERLYRLLYDEVRVGEAPNFGSEQYMSMDTAHLDSQTGGIMRVMFNRTLPLFYAPLVIVLLAISFVF